ncbi:MAG: MerR family transcriptional regulator [Eubacteriales bacterium]|nr:MerR family transcriptional regulator [Eubacteriales bacterium]
MKIKEMEERTGIARANIRFYESKGLLHPERQGNNYRDYSETDVETLRKIILLRRLGLSIEDIQAVFCGELALQDAVQRTERGLQEQLEQLQGSLELCAVMQERQETLETLSVDTYDELIRRREQQGKKFRDIMTDVLEDYQKNWLEKNWGSMDIQGSRTKGAIVTLCISALLCTLLNTGLKGFWKGLEDTLAMLAAFAAASVIYLLISFIGRVFPPMRDPLRIATVIFLLFVVVLVAIGVLNSCGIIHL